MSKSSQHQPISQPIFYSSTRSNLVTSSSPHDPILIHDEYGQRAIVDQQDIDEPKNGENDKPTPKQGSFTTIFSIWNTMMGSSLLAIPWGFSQSGTLGGVITMIVVALVCYYTCYLIVKHGTGYDDFFDLCNDYLGRWGQLLCWGSSLLVLLGALMAYDGLMSDCLYSAVNGIRDYISDSKYEEERFWNKKLSPLIIFITMFPMTNFKELTLFVKLNSYGLIAVLYIVVFIIYTSVGVQGISSDLPPIYESHFPKFGGILTLSFFIHNCILPILKNAREPQYNTRNMGIAFILVGLSYATIGFIAYIAYHNYEQAIPQDFLTIFSDTNIPAIIARICLLLQLFTVFPLIVYIMRCQFFGLLYGNTYPSMSRVIIHNLIVCILCTLVSIFFPHVGDILRFTGASCGLIYVFILPIGVHMMKTYPSSIPSIIDGDVENISSPYMSLPPQDQSLVHIANDSANHVQHTELIPDRVYERKGWIFWSSVIGHTALIVFGTASLVGQFI